ncbi:MAG: ABC transporter ATP-binding protein, partial [Solirubrobacteraceae bacterium]
PAPAARGRTSGPSKNARARVVALEQEIEAAEGALGALEAELADPAAWADPDRATASAERHAEARRVVERLYDQLEQAAS